MKQPKKLIRDQKIILDRNGIRPEQYSLIEETHTALVLQDKSNGTRITVPKQVAGKGATPWVFVKPER